MQQTMSCSLFSNYLYYGFTNGVTALGNLAFPVKKMGDKHRNSLKQPWMTFGLLKSCNKKSKLYIKYLKNRTADNIAKYIKYRNKFKTIRIKAEQLYYANEFTKNRHNLKKTWSIIRSLIKSGKDEDRIDGLLINDLLMTDSILTADKFIEFFFTNIGQSLAEKIPSSNNTYEYFMTRGP